MYTIGLCGGSGSGKGRVCEEFLKYGIPSIDTDSINREQLAAGGISVEPLTEAFGEEILTPDGAIDKARLAELVFGPDGAEAKKILEAITHKNILERVREWIIFTNNTTHPPASIIDAPLLFESGFDSECNIIIAVLCDKDTRIKRIIERDNISYERALMRVNSQLDDDILRKRADFVIINDGKRDLASQVSEIAANILRRR